MLSSFRLCETVVPLEDPIITETTSTLQEWGVLWKQLYVVSSTILPHMQYHSLFDEQSAINIVLYCDFQESWE